MTINAMIPLATEVPNLARSVTGGAVAGNQLMNLIEDRKLAPMRQQAAQMELEAGKMTLSKEKAIEQLRNAAIDGSYIRRDLASGDLNTAISRMEQRNRRIMESGGDNQHTQQWLSALSSRDPAQIQAVAAEMEEIERAYQAYGGGGGAGSTAGASAKTKQYVDGTVQMVMPDGSVQVRLPNGQTVQGEQAALALQQAMLNEVAYAGQKAGAAANAQGAAKVEYAGPAAFNAGVGGTQGNQVGAMGAPGIPSAADVQAQQTAATEQAKAEAQAAADRNALARTNAVALDGYNAAMSGLSEALGNTGAGYFAGRMPAIGADAQIAEGAIAAVAPVLKQLFRTSGEGVFTDKDQQLLMEMVPKRTDETEAQKSKLANIDAIVRAKLGQGAQAQQSQPGQQANPMEGKTAVNPQTGQRAIMRNGQWVAQ